ncbi:MAG: VIT1/CCC1 transporter family protein [bacterium]
MQKQNTSLKKLKTHLKEEHNISTVSTYLKEIIYGGNDGIITTFVVVSGFSGAQSISGNPIIPAFTVLLFGLANLFGDGVSMGLGNFISLRSQQDQYIAEKNKELYEIKNDRNQEKKETMTILTARGFKKNDAKKIIDLYSKNDEYWAKFMMKYELQLPDPESENPYLTALATFSAFIFFGFIPLIPYFFLHVAGFNSFIISMLFTFGALVLLGLLRWYVIKRNMIRSIGEILMVGIAASSVSYFVGTFFR